MSTSVFTPSRATGFTLIEVMIVVAIIAILASVAMPAYTDHVRRGQIQEAFANLSAYSTRLEQYYQDNRRYAATATGTTTCAGAANATLTEAELGSEAEFFTYSCVPSNNAQGYTITATGSSGAATGNTYTLNHTGQRGTTRFKGKASTATCWLTKSAC
jgi:type IV pilus assembly protein PilE